ncbi:hypothetical protein Tco_1382836, partial [Tanacetum coccineum]
GDSCPLCPPVSAHDGGDGLKVERWVMVAVVEVVAAVGVLFKLEIIIDVIVWWMFGQRLRSKGDDLEAVERSGWGGLLGMVVGCWRWRWFAGDGGG